MKPAHPIAQLRRFNEKVAIRDPRGVVEFEVLDVSEMWSIKFYSFTFMPALSLYPT